MEIYLENLIKQFILANGIKHPDTNSKNFIIDFYVWLNSRKDIGEQYAHFLNYLNFYFASSKCAEVGKSQYDSVGAEFGTTIITPVPDSYTGIDPKRIISGNMQVWDGKPMLLRYKEGQEIAKSIPYSTITTYMTQNPFFSSNIWRWEDIHNSGINDIIVGIYGSIYDKDFEQKMQQMKLLKEGLNGRYIDDYSVNGDNYYYAIGSLKFLEKVYREVTVENLDQEVMIRTR